MLVGLGVDELSVSVPADRPVKAQIRAAHARGSAASSPQRGARRCATAAEVRALVAAEAED